MLSRTLLAVSAFLIVAAHHPAGSQPDDVGPKVGEAVPDFSGRDQTGRVRSLQSLIGPNGAVLVFFRSADW